VVIHPVLQTIEVNDNEVTADAGALTVQVARASVAAGLTGFEWAVGVPGTIGGAVRGNAGCMGGEIKDSLKWVEVFKDGEVQRLTNAQCDFHYRDSLFKREGGVILRACFKLAPDTLKQGAKKMVEYLQYRTKTQPKAASSGCMFKNVALSAIPQDKQKNLPEVFINKQQVPAGWLVQEVGGKGMRVGGAAVSEIHGNFIVNDNGATAGDILALAVQIKEKVAEKFGVELEEEVQII
jgi:UDP-N-acetylmuramate dehydrogenase